MIVITIKKLNINMFKTVLMAHYGKINLNVYN